MRIPNHFTCFLRNLYAGQEATVRTRHGTKDWFKIGKGVRQGCILSPCLFHLYAEHIIQNARPDDSQAGIKIAWRNINNLRYADDTILVAESKEDVSPLTFFVCVWLPCRACGILVLPYQGWTLQPLHWKLGVLTTELRGESLC